MYGLGCVINIRSIREHLSHDERENIVIIRKCLYQYNVAVTSFYAYQDICNQKR